MRLSEYTDYTLRVLMHCAEHPERLVTIAEIAQRHDLSRSHLMKIVNDLGRQGLVETVRGRGGGLRLKPPAHQVRIGDVVRRTETDFRLVECFDSLTNTCMLDHACRLKKGLAGALRSFLQELDKLTLADVCVMPESPSRARAIPLVPAAKAAPPARKAARGRRSAAPARQASREAAR